MSLSMLDSVWAVRVNGVVQSMRGSLGRTYVSPEVAAVVVVILIAWIPSIYRWVSKAYRAGRGTASFTWPAPVAASKDWTGRVLDDPHLFAHKDDSTLLADTTEKSAQYLTCYDPATGFHIETIALATPGEITASLQRGSNAQKHWRHTTFAQRTLFLRSLKAWILRDMETIIAVACRDTGKTRVDAVFGEILTTLSKIDYLVSNAESLLAPSSRSTPLLLLHKRSKVVYEPLGLIAALVSWNYSMHNALSPILAGLMVGNAVVVKCSEQVAWSSKWFVGAVRECLTACGLDPEVVQLVICLPENAELVTKSKLVKHITFIGSESVGRKVAAAAAENLIPTCIELGGKDPCVLLPGADVEFFASTFMRGAFQAAGQNCIGLERFLVHRSQYERFITLVQPRIHALRCGPSITPDASTIDVGSLISRQFIEPLEKSLANAVSEGAVVLAGGQPFKHPQYPAGAYFQPTLLGNVGFEMAIAQNESFAPVMAVMPYDSVDELVDGLNAGRYGLGAAVFGKNKRECRDVASRLECGMVAINDFGVFYLNQAMPFGGVKASGHGRFGGPEGLLSLCSAKAITEDRFFDWIKTSIPTALDYPLPDGDKSWNFLRGLVGFAYGGSLIARAKGIIGLIKGSL